MPDGGLAAWMFPALFALVFAGVPVGFALIAVAADFITLRVLISLRVESQVIVSGRHAVLPLLACGALVLVYPLILVPYFGWFFAPILWAVCAQVRVQSGLEGLSP